MSLFKSGVEAAFFRWLYNEATDFADEGMSTARCFELAGEKHGLPAEIVEWAAITADIESALEAGIPRSVIDGITKLSDHFSQDYIDHMRGKR